MTSLVATKNERGRPLSFCRESVISEVTELFWTHGYSTLSLSSIAQKLGLKRSSLYNSFETKEKLFWECLAHYGNHSPTKCLMDYQAGQAVGPMLHKMLADISTLRAKDKLSRGCLAVNTFNELATRDSSLGQKLRERQQTRLNLMAQVIEHATAQGELPADTDAVITANIVFSFMAGLNMHAKNGASEQELVDMSRVFLQKIGF